MAGSPIPKMKIEINNRQKSWHPRINNIKKLIRKLMYKAMPLSPKLKWSEISVVLMNDEQIRECKTKLFDIREITDVISLRYNPMPGENNLYSGEIFVNIQRAITHSAKIKQRWTASKELSLYLAHGCDHLMDSTDYDKQGYLRMRRRELNWLKDLEIAKLSTNLL